MNEITQTQFLGDFSRLRSRVDIQGASPEVSILIPGWSISADIGVETEPEIVLSVTLGAR